MIIGDYVGNFIENELLLTSPELPHLWKSDTAYYQKDKKLFTKAMGLYFPSELIHAICEDVEILSLYNNLMQKAERGIRFYGKTKEEIIKKLREISLQTGLAQVGTFLHIIHLMSSSNDYKPLANVGYRSVNNGSDIERFNAVYQYLLKNFSGEIMLEEVAAICNMTETSFCRYFKQKTQKTFTYFLNEIRIGHAKKLLQNEHLPIKEICYECGYNNPTNFFKFFKLIVKKARKNIEIL
ncbi:AraC family transcriptional regulator [Niabella ginsengisoli]|uniref:AraC family transcriptional regulator n=1 Tax=Niabella ginsengisoli TaxID=522298 RepID=A0ABS9SI61_9BACT|nr:AraC family transcriptional regulator [Niabella ginsengisoli]MCH5598037.1 AraC family transcriptional regulator [Niabella ginsengisoli]